MYSYVLQMIYCIISVFHASTHIQAYNRWCYKWRLSSVWYISITLSSVLFVSRCPFSPPWPKCYKFEVCPYAHIRRRLTILWQLLASHNVVYVGVGFMHHVCKSYLYPAHSQSLLTISALRTSFIRWNAVFGGDVVVFFILISWSYIALRFSSENSLTTSPRSTSR